MDFADQSWVVAKGLAIEVRNVDQSAMGSSKWNLSGFIVALMGHAPRPRCKLTEAVSSQNRYQPGSDIPESSLGLRSVPASYRPLRKESGG